MHIEGPGDLRQTNVAYHKKAITEINFFTWQPWKDVYPVRYTSLWVLLYQPLYSFRPNMKRGLESSGNNIQALINHLMKRTLHVVFNWDVEITQDDK